jgi:hypothetical protein
MIPSSPSPSLGASSLLSSLCPSDHVVSSRSSPYGYISGESRELRAKLMQLSIGVIRRGKLADTPEEDVWWKVGGGTTGASGSGSAEF